MSYLYGDSTPSPLESNFLQFLGESLDFSVHILLSAERLKHFTKNIAKLKEEADAELARLDGLLLSVSTSLDGPKGSAGAPAASCAEAILVAAGEIVEKYAAQVRATLAADLAGVAAQEAAEREGCLRALEGLVRGHDLPEATTTLQLIRDGATYATTRTMKAAFGLECTMALEIASPHAFSQIARVDKLVPSLEIYAPESSGWLRKEVKSRPQRLEKHYLSELIFAPGATTLRMRASLDAGAPGFDFEVRAREEPRVRAFRVGESGASPEPLEVSDEDAAKLLGLEEKLRALALEVGQSGARLRAATVDGAPFLDLADPGVLVERLVAAMAPITQQIARHSLAPTELVLKRLLGDHRREEIFVSKAALQEKLSPLPEPLRGTFRALGLSDTTGARKVLELVDSPPPRSGPNRVEDLDSDELSEVAPA